MGKYLNIVKYWRNSLADAEKVNPSSIQRDIQVETKQVEENALTEKIFDKVYDEATKSRGKDEEEELNLSKGIEVLICPFYYQVVNFHTKTISTLAQKIYPLWMPAKIFEDGHLEPNNDKPCWIPRNYLSPSTDVNSPIIGELADLEKYLINNPIEDYGTDWHKELTYSMDMYNAVVTDNIEYYERINRAVIIVDDVPGNTTRHIVYAMDYLIRKAQIPNLLRTLCCVSARQEKPLLSPETHIKYSSLHLGQMNYEFPLSESQREALHHFFDIYDYEILAVNGPPGTGKTTLIHSIIASLWVKAAYENSNKPPIIAIASATNQAVTNVIDSFSRVFNSSKLATNKEAKDRLRRFINSRGDIEQFSARWLPDVCSYGLYLASSGKYKKNSDNTDWQITNTMEAGFPSRENDSNYVENGTKYFLERASSYFGEDIENLDTAKKHIHKELEKAVRAIENIVDSRAELYRVIKTIFTQFPDLDQNEELESQLTNKLYVLKQVRGELNDKHNKEKDNYLNTQAIINSYKEDFSQWKKHIKACSWWLKIYSSFSSHGKWRVQLRNKDYILSQKNLTGKIKSLDQYLDGITEKQGDDIFWELIADEEKVLKEIEEQVDKILSQKEHIEKQHNELKEHQLNLEQAQDEWEQYIICYGLSPKKEEWMESLDVSLRFLAFLWATHYWEARWLEAAKKLIEKNQKRNSYQNTVNDKYHRYVMLTPAMVTTLYMLPGYFKYYDGAINVPYVNFIDLLIIDEAGQVLTDVVSASFALSKKALVLGDVQQLEPVWSLPPHVDIGNLKRYRIIEKDGEFLDVVKQGITSSQNSLMELAQNACKYHKTYPGGRPYPERGMFLCEHYRCDKKIIQICNELAYHGRLIPFKGKETRTGLLPPLGYVDIDGRSEKVGTSRKNKTEAEIILKWIIDKQQYLLKTYGKGSGKHNIEDIVAILTPFTAQANLIYQIIKNEGYTDLSDIIIGTVNKLQGSEREVIIFSPVYSSEDETTFMLDKNPSLLNVAISRARSSFLFFGNMSILKGHHSAILHRHLIENGEPVA